MSIFMLSEWPYLKWYIWKKRYILEITHILKVTNEYPYGECKNAAQVYKKVSQVST